MYQKPFISGIGGTGVSNIATFFLNRGVQVFGSSDKPNSTTEALEKRGAEIVYTQSGENIERIRPDALFYSQAVLGGPGKAEVETAEKLGIPTFRNAAGYWEIIGKEKQTIAISGAHGKTTTTALASLAFTTAGIDPICISGSAIKEFGNSSFREGEGEIFVVEACEYREQFYGLAEPKGIVILNIEHDHPDYYHNVEEVQEAFTNFGKQVSADGFVLGFADDQYTVEVLAELERAGKHVYRYGEQVADADFRITDITGQAELTTWTIEIAPRVQSTLGIDLAKLELATRLIGHQNVWNTTAAVCAALLVDPKRVVAKLPEVIEALRDFEGTYRRQEYLGRYQDIPVYDDYAHHPTQIKLTLEAFHKKFPKLGVLFEPHQCSRTRDLFDQFVTSFGEAEKLMLFPIFVVPGRDTEADCASVSIENLAQKIKAEGVKVELMSGSEALPAVLEKLKAAGVDCILNLGAGPLSTKLQPLITKDAT